MTKMDRRCRRLTLDISYDLYSNSTSHKPLIHKWLQRNLRPPRDLDHNGSIGLLNAFYLARQIKDNHNLLPQCDLNNDGAVNRTDVDPNKSKISLSTTA